MAHECMQDKTIKELVRMSGEVEANIKILFKTIKEIKENDLRHLNAKIDAMLFSVLAMLIIAILRWFLKL
ncbi:MAG: hypothetical protein DRP75_04185 [Candidatus Omnitrophota bacterium]|nr:MAG: hypothetical protein DRP75_04185 [Candidatus Omnitrophota bacterium]